MSASTHGAFRFRQRSPGGPPVASIRRVPGSGRASSWGGERPLGEWLRHCRVAPCREPVQPDAAVRFAAHNTSPTHDTSWGTPTAPSAIPAQGDADILRTGDIV